jgi:hypothetical protein
LWIYGYVRFTDFLGNPHETRFVTMGLLHSDKPGSWFTFVYSSETPPLMQREHSAASAALTARARIPEQSRMFPAVLGRATKFRPAAWWRLRHNTGNVDF